MRKHIVLTEISSDFYVGTWCSEISGQDAKKHWKKLVQWSLFHAGREACFSPLSDANSALNAPAITRAGGMLSILLFSANPCGNQNLLAASGVVLVEAGA